MSDQTPQRIGAFVEDVVADLHLTAQPNTPPAVERRIPCSHVPPRFAQRFLDSFDQRTKAQKAAVVATERLVAGQLDSLVLIGGPGCGKSTLAAIACNEIADANEAEADELRDQVEALRRGDRDQVNPYVYRALQEKLERLDRRIDRKCPRWLNVGRTVVDLKGEMSANGHELVDRLRQLRETRGLLVLDDLGRERISEWTAEILYAIVSERYDGQLPTMATSNVSAADLQRLGYGAIMSRLADRGEILELSGADYRLRRGAA